MSIEETTFIESSWKYWLSMFCLHVASSLCCAIVHRTIYYQFELSYWSMNCFQYLSSVLVSLVPSLLCYNDRIKFISIKHILPISIAETTTVVLSSILHQDGSDNALNKIRSTDFVVTIFVGWIASRSFEQSCKPKRIKLMFITSVFSSMAFLESNLSYDYLYLSVFPLLVVSSVVQYLITFQTIHKVEIGLSALFIQSSFFTFIFLLPFAYFFGRDGVSSTSYHCSSDLVPIEYFMIIFAIIGFSSMSITKFWLLCRCSPELFFNLKSTKYLLGSYCLLFVQQLSFINVISCIGKLGATVSIIISAYIVGTNA